MTGPISGVRVLDVGTYAIGPSAASYLGQLGAEVIRIENPAGEAFMDFEPTIGGMAASYINANMAKKNIFLDLKDQEGVQLAHRLVGWADVLIENRLPGVIEKLGLGYGEASKINPRIVYISMPGFSATGPFAGRPALDMEIQALSGFASIEGAEGAPAELFRVYAHLDHTTALALVQAAILGLIARQRTGVGRRIVVGFFGSSMFLQLTRIAEFFATGRSPQRAGSASTLIAPSQSFPCMDSRFVNISAPDEGSWERLCVALDQESLREDDRFLSNELRLQNRDALAQAISRRTEQAPAWWWLRHLRKCGVACGPVYTFEEMERDPQLRAEGMIVDVQTPWGKIVRGAAPWRFSETPCGPIEPTHKPGSDQQEVRAS